jgi:hypothetical protein
MATSDDRVTIAQPLYVERFSLFTADFREFSQLLGCALSGAAGIGQPAAQPPPGRGCL